MDRFSHTNTCLGGFTALNLSYLDQADAFAVNNQVRDWPLTSNRFVRGMAQRIQGGCTLQIELATFMEIAGLLTSANAKRTYTFSALLEPTWGSDPKFTVVLVETVADQQPPIMADNAGFFQYAMKWFSAQSITGAHLTFSVTANALFWVH